VSLIPGNLSSPIHSHLTHTTHRASKPREMIACICFVLLALSSVGESYFVNGPKIDAAFAALKTDGSVVAWGDGGTGGDTSSVAGSLKSGVVSIYSTGQAFAALKTDGSVVACQLHRQ
jgi:hypothetical protein